MSRELIADKLKNAMGLHMPTVGMVTVSSAIDNRMRACGIMNENEYLMRINSDPDEMKELIETVIIPETWFFRENQPYNYVLNYIFEQEQEYTTRILSMPCSTGEEPYSISMMLMNNHVHPKRYTIDAVDIAKLNIDKAKIGRYRKNSFRSDDKSFMNNYFTEKDGLFHISDKVKKQVNFHCENVLGQSFSLSDNQYDVIFCRNLLIYFDDDTQRKMFSILKKMLLPNGLLVLGHAETVQHSNGEFVFAVDSNAYVYVKKDNLRKSQQHQKDSQKKPFKEKRNHSRPFKKTSRPFLGTKNSVTPIKRKELSDEDLGIAFELADKGDLIEALKICNSYIKDNPESSRAYYLSGLVNNTQGDLVKANEHLRKAIYLDPENLEALIHLSLLARQNGNNDEADKLKLRAQRVKERRAG